MTSSLPKPVAISRPHLVKAQGRDLGLLGDDNCNEWFHVAAYRGFVAIGYTWESVYRSVKNAYDDFLRGSKAMDDLADFIDSLDPSTTKAPNAIH